jgi:hypothetical protein
VRFQTFKSEGRIGLGIVNSAGELRGELAGTSSYPGGLLELLGKGNAAVRDYQLRTTQWTLGKNFDGTGAFGPTFVTADEA